MNQVKAPNNVEVGSIKIRQEIIIIAPKARVFDALLDDMSHWWGAPFLLGDEPKRLVAERKLGGLVWEDWGDGNGATWGTVTRFHRGECYEFTGRCGMSGAVLGVICYELKEKNGATLLQLEHDVIGQITDETMQNYSWGWGELLANRLKRFVENGECLGLLKK